MPKGVWRIFQLPSVTFCPCGYGYKTAARSRQQKILVLPVLGGIGSCGKKLLLIVASFFAGKIQVDIQSEFRDIIIFRLRPDDKSVFGKRIQGIYPVIFIGTQNPVMGKLFHTMIAASFRMICFKRLMRHRLYIIGKKRIADTAEISGWVCDIGAVQETEIGDVSAGKFDSVISIFQFHEGNPPMTPIILCRNRMSSQKQTEDIR